MFTLEEVDGSQYVMEKDDLGGVKVRPRGTTKGPRTQRDGGKKNVKDEDDEEEEGGDGGYEEVAVVEADDNEEEDNESDRGEEEAVVMDTADDEGLVGGGEEEGAGGDSKAESKAKRKKRRNERRRLKKRQKRAVEEEAAKAGAPASGTTGVKQEPGGESGAKEAVAVDLPAWAPQSLGGVELHPLLLRNLARQDFVRPTPIQQATLPIAMAPGKSKVGVSSTVDGGELVRMAV